MKRKVIDKTSTHQKGINSPAYHCFWDICRLAIVHITNHKRWLVVEKISVFYTALVLGWVLSKLHSLIYLGNFRSDSITCYIRWITPIFNRFRCKIWTCYSMGSTCFGNSEKLGKQRKWGKWLSNSYPIVAHTKIDRVPEILDIQNKVNCKDERRFKHFF